MARAGTKEEEGVAAKGRRTVFFCPFPLFYFLCLTFFFPNEDLQASGRQEESVQGKKRFRVFF